MELKQQGLLNPKPIVTNFCCRKYSTLKTSILFLAASVLFSCSDSNDSSNPSYSPINNPDPSCPPIDKKPDPSCPPIDKKPDPSRPPIGNPDPLYSHQWHLHNTGQPAFSEAGGIRGADLKLQGVSQTGAGVVVNVIDTGIELTHEDLAGNISLTIRNNFPVSSANDSVMEHGTAVAGIIAAKANNGVGGRGVAPGATLISNNYLNAQQGAGSRITSLTTTADIVNQSYVFVNKKDVRLLAPHVEAAIKDRVTNGRLGKGTIFVKAAGNGFNRIKTKTETLDCSSNKTGKNIAENSSLTCQNASMDPVNTLPYNIVVAAVNAARHRASYSTAGSAIFVSGLGGEKGVYAPAVITTDKEGCQQGYSKDTGERATPIPKALDPNCNYTHYFNGTSAAVPMVSGVIALMLEANPALTWRDVRYILAHSADKIYGNSVYKTVTDNPDVISDATAELGWTRNASGLEFHNWYGFGLVNASSAVRMARGYTSRLGNNFGKTLAPTAGFKGVNKKILDKSVISDSLTINRDIIIEMVRVDIKITHSYSADIGVFLVSPSATTSLLLNFGNIFGASDDLDFILSTEAFYGENARGEWKIQVMDYVSSDTGNFDEWRLEIYGAEAP